MSYPAQTRLGIAPVVVGAVIQAVPAISEWVTGHSDMYTAMQAAIPQLGQRAITNGDVCAYIVVRAWSGDETWCPLANRSCGPYEINMRPGDTGPCGAAPGLKALARDWRARIEQQAPNVSAAGVALFNGATSADVTGARVSGAGPVATVPTFATASSPAMASLFGNISPVVLLGGAGLLLLGWLTSQKR